jgi:hypothetical protein
MSIITVKWLPEDNIPGNNKGILSWDSKLTNIKVFSSVTNTLSTRSGVDKDTLSVPTPSKGMKTYTYVFYKIGQAKPIHTFSIRVSSQPLVFVKWIPTFEFDKNTGERNGIGTVKIFARGVTSIQMFGQDIVIPPAYTAPGSHFDAPLTLPTAIALVVRDPAIKSTEVIINAVVSVDNTKKNVKLVFLID